MHVHFSVCVCACISLSMCSAYKHERRELDGGSYRYTHSGIGSPAGAWQLDPAAVLCSVHPFYLVGSRKFCKILWDVHLIVQVTRKHMF